MSCGQCGKLVDYSRRSVRLSNPVALSRTLLSHSNLKYCKDTEVSTKKLCLHSDNLLRQLSLFAHNQNRISPGRRKNLTSILSIPKHVLSARLRYLSKLATVSSGVSNSEAMACCRSPRAASCRYSSKATTSSEVEHSKQDPRRRASCSVD